MRVVIVGAGSLGAVFAALLARVGHDVVLVGRRSLRNDGPEGLLGHAERPPDPTEGSLDHAGGQPRRQAPEDSRMQVHLRGCIELEASVPYTTRAPAGADLLMLCTKAIDTPAQLRPLAYVAPKAVLSLQNSIHKNRYLAEAFGAERVLGAATMVSAERRADGVVLLTSLGNTFVGATRSAALDRSAAMDQDSPLDRGDAPGHGASSGQVAFAEQTARAFAEAGLPSVLVEDVERLEWAKACFVAGGFAVATITGLSADRFFPNPDLARVFLSLVQEVATIAAANGREVIDYPGLPIHTLLELVEEKALTMLREVAARFVEAPFPAKPSMLQDLEAGRPLEVEENLGALLEEARRAGVAAPRLEMAVRFVRGLACAHRPAD